MANTYNQCYFHLVFSVKNRDALIKREWKDELERYITGIIHNHRHKMLAIGTMPDHIHILIGFRPTQSLSDLMQDIKGDSSKWINENNFVKGRFCWQSGFGAFSYSKSHVPTVIRYIQNQEIHHKKKTFLEEYKKMLDDFGIDYSEFYIFKPVE